jgi:2-haloacid dehalogenase
MNEFNEVIFDLYGTLVDVHSVARRADELFKGRGIELSRLWRQKQLEYTWLLTLMNRYEPFEIVTQRALTFSLKQLNLSLRDSEREALGNEYMRLEPYPATLESLKVMRAAGLRVSVLSNGSEKSIYAVLTHAGLLEVFDGVHSVERAQRFKPDPAAYRTVVQPSSTSISSMLFISSNSWDATGAGHFGFKTCWINRTQQTFEEMGYSPTMTVDGIAQLAAHLTTRG